MRQPHSRFSDLSTYYLQSSLATGVLLALSRRRHELTLRPRDKRVLKFAAGWLAKLEEGESFRTGEQVTPAALQGRIYLEESMAIVPPEEASDLKSFFARLRTYIKQLIETDTVAGEDPVEEQLHEFMKNYRALQRSLIADNRTRNHVTHTGITFS